ncbi:MAG: methionyl-tRNA formyltransferase [Armatimonadetes bacterium]|nr:methionyl-tRNA formyltransferase [Armatimonadota bacterium]
MRLIYMGTPEFAVPPLIALLEAGHEVVAVVTQPDKPVGRKRTLTPPPVKAAALERGIPVLQPNSARSPAFHDQVRAYAPEVIGYAAYGKMLPQAFLDLPPHGCLNVHASLLPKYRGAAPIQWAIMNGETVTGVSIMRAEAGLDTGPVLLAAEEPIRDDDTAGTLAERLSHLGARLLAEGIRRAEAGTASFTPQDDSEATHAPLLTLETARMDWTRPARDLRNQVRGLNPKPGALTRYEGREVKVWRAEVREGQGSPGTVLVVEEAGPVVVAGGGALCLTEVQPAGSRRMSGAEFVRGQRVEAGRRFDSAASPAEGQ